MFERDQILYHFKMKNSIKYFFVKHEKQFIFHVLFLLVALSLFHKYIFGNEVFIFSPKDVGADTIHLYFPMLIEFVQNESSDFWKLNYGLGSNTFPFFVTFKLDPFFQLAKLLPLKIDVALIYIHILKLYIIGVFFRKFIRFYIENEFIVVFLSIAFVYSGFIMLWGQHYFFTNAVLYFIILLYGYERLIENNTKWIFFIGICLMTTQIYFLIQFALFLVIYLIFRKIYYRQLIRHTIYNGIKALKVSILAVLTSAFIFLPILYCLMTSPRINTNISELSNYFTLQSNEYYITLLGRFFSNNFMGNRTNYFGNDNYYSFPEVYSTILFFLLVLHTFRIKNKEKRKSIIYLLIISFSLLLIPLFGYAFNLFQILYYRFSFMNIFINILVLGLILEEIVVNKIINFKLLAISCGSILVVWCLLLVYTKRHDGEWSYNNLVGAYDAQKYVYVKLIVFKLSIILFLYFIIFIIFRNRIKYLFYLLFTVLSIELINENYLTFNTIGSISRNNEYYKDENFSDCQKYLKIHDNEKFYRVEKDYFSFFISFNDALIQNYYGVKSYNSLPPSSVVDFYKKAKVIDDNYWINILPSWDPMLKQTNLYNVLGVKYFVSKNNLNIVSTQFEEIAKIDSMRIYKNKDYYPFGKICKKFVSEIEIDRNKNCFDSVIQLQNTFCKDIDLTLLKKYERTDINKSEKFNLISVSNEVITGKVDLLKKSCLFFSIPFEKGWNVKIDNIKTEIKQCNIGFMGVMIPKGKHKVVLTYKQPFWDLGRFISMITVISIAIFYIYKKIIHGGAKL